MGLAPLNQTLAWARQNDVQDFEEVAIYYLSNNEGRWRTWVSSQAYEKIKAALDEAGAPED